MAIKRHHTEAPPPFSAVLGGMAAALVALLVFSALVQSTGGTDDSAPLVAALIGIAATTTFLVGGLYLTVSLPWLASALVFAGGFTALWSTGASFAAEPRLPALLALGAAIVLVMAFGWRRLSRAPASEAVPAGGDAS